MNAPTRKTLLKHFPNLGPCLICQLASYRQNHRRIDALRDRFHGGDSIAAIARDFEIPVRIVQHVVTTPLHTLNFLRRNFTKSAEADLQAALTRRS